MFPKCLKTDPRCQMEPEVNPRKPQKGCQKPGIQMAARRVQTASGWIYTVIRMSPRWLKTGPECRTEPQIGRKKPKRASKRPQKGSKRAPEYPKRDPNGCKTCSKCLMMDFKCHTEATGRPQEGPKRPHKAPEGIQQGPKITPTNSAELHNATKAKRNTPTCRIYRFFPYISALR